MKVFKRIGIFLVLTLAVLVLNGSLSFAGEPVEYEIDVDHTQVIFKVKHLGISTVTGQFELFEGTYSLDQENIENAKVETKIVASSIDTKKQKRDDHLRSPDFLDVEKYPEITFVSKSVKKGEGDDFQIVGDLTIHGVTKEVTLDATYGGAVTDPWGNERSAFTASTTINRKDFGMTWNKVLEAGGFVVGDDVNIILEVEGIRKKS